MDVALVKEPGAKLINCTEMSKSWLAWMLSPFLGLVKTEETMLLAEGIFPMAAKGISNIRRRRICYHLRIPLHEPSRFCSPLVSVWPEQKLMKLLSSLNYVSGLYSFLSVDSDLRL